MKTNLANEISSICDHHISYRNRVRDLYAKMINLFTDIDIDKSDKLLDEELIDMFREISDEVNTRCLKSKEYFDNMYGKTVSKFSTQMGMATIDWEYPLDRHDSYELEILSPEETIDKFDEYLLSLSLEHYYCGDTDYSTTNIPLSALSSKDALDEWIGKLVKEYECDLGIKYEEAFTEHNKEKKERDEGEYLLYIELKKKYGES